VVTASGGELLVAVTVRGPLTVMGACDPSLTARAETMSGRLVTPSPSPWMDCFAIALIPIPAGTPRYLQHQHP